MRPLGLAEHISNIDAHVSHRDSICMSHVPVQEVNEAKGIGVYASVPNGCVGYRSKVGAIASPIDRLVRAHGRHCSPAEHKSKVYDLASRTEIVCMAQGTEFVKLMKLDIEARLMPLCILLIEWSCPG